MGFFCLYLMRAALELAKYDHAYELLATKFFEHFIYIGAAMKKMGGRDYQLWDEQDGFFYDVLRLPNGDFNKFRLRSMVGLIPLYAVEVIEPRRPGCSSRISRESRVVHQESSRPGRKCLLLGRRPALRAFDRGLRPVCPRFAAHLGSR